MRDTTLRLKLLMSFAYWYDFPIEIFVACTVEGQVSRDDELYLYDNETLGGSVATLRNFMALHETIGGWARDLRNQ